MAVGNYLRHRSTVVKNSTAAKDTALRPASLSQPDGSPSRSACARMGLLVGRAEIGCADVRVDLRGDKALVPEQLLDAANVGTAVEQVRSKAVAQRVGGRARIESDRCEVFVEESGHAASGQTRAKFIDE